MFVILGMKTTIKELLKKHDISTEEIEAMLKVILYDTRMTPYLANEILKFVHTEFSEPDEMELYETQEQLKELTKAHSKMIAVKPENRFDKMEIVYTYRDGGTQVCKYKGINYVRRTPIFGNQLKWSFDAFNKFPEQEITNEEKIKELNKAYSKI